MDNPLDLLLVHNKTLVLASLVFLLVLVFSFYRSILDHLLDTHTIHSIHIHMLDNILLNNHCMDYQNNHKTLNYLDMMVSLLESMSLALKLSEWQSLELKWLALKLLENELD